MYDASRYVLTIDLVNRAADDKRQPDEDPEHEDARRRVAALDLGGKLVFAVPRVDDEETGDEAEDADGSVDRTL